jgi:hypothetical protein
MRKYYVNTYVLTTSQQVWQGLAMPVTAKRSQLQIRVSEKEKSAIRRAAERAGMDMSTYVLSRVLSHPAVEFQQALDALKRSHDPSFALADINASLSTLTASELRDAVAAGPEAALAPFLANYVAAMVEFACARRGIALPAWTQRIAPLDEPAFGSPLLSLRLHLLTQSPAPFRRRNIFVDATLGNQV